IESYLLDEDQFILLVLLAKNTPESVALKVRVAKEFRRLKKIVSNIVAQQRDPNWVNVRSDGKIAYKQKTTIIKQFVDYATNQGSKSASMYYANLAKMENKALFFMEQKYDNLRDILTIKQLMQACTADYEADVLGLKSKNTLLIGKEIKLKADMEAITLETATKIEDAKLEALAAQNGTIEQYQAQLKEKDDNLAIVKQEFKQACTADDVIEQALVDGMNDGLHYKDIYKLAKERIGAFVAIIGKSQVHLLEDKQQQLIKG
ncbi:hypothetical protein OAA60_06050, partial [Porticoccaceae bacterium]|nr:hypothetical protein [Porticoccaceae bacterium]